MEWNKADVEFLGKNFNALSRKILCKQLKRSWQAIHIKAKRIKLNRDQNSMYYVNTDYFEKINIPEKAYILGLLWSDGFITSGYFGISLVDLDVLLWIRQELEYEGRVMIGTLAKKNRKTLYVLRIGNAKMIQDLRILGMMENKSWIIKFPKLSKALQSSFICGLFDGDGSIHVPTIDKKWKCTRRITFSGNQYVVATLKRILIQNGFSKTKIKIEKNGTNVLQYVTKHVELFWNKYYSKSPYRMKRKERKFLDNEIVHQRIFFSE